MKRLAILSDIHGNLPALEAVLADIEAAGLDELWCLGDVVGYGAEPDECARLVSEHCSVCLAGNHDLAALGELDVAAFSPNAATAVEWTRANAAPETLDFLRTLEPSDTSHEVALYHASPRDPVWEYVLWPDQAAECLAVQAARVSLIGHSHVALFFVEQPQPEGGAAITLASGETVGGPSGAGGVWGREEPRGAQAGGGTELDLSEGRWLVNPGSVGQPRDGDPRAAWLELDIEGWSATYRRIEYDVERAAMAISEAGLPEQLAQRLHIGQ